MQRCKHHIPTRYTIQIIYCYRVHTLFQAKISRTRTFQGLFKDFPGPYFEISRTFLYTNLATAKQNVCVESHVWA